MKKLIAALIFYVASLPGLAQTQTPSYLPTTGGAITGTVYGPSSSSTAWSITNSGQGFFTNLVSPNPVEAPNPGVTYLISLLYNNATTHPQFFVSPDPSEGMSLLSATPTFTASEFRDPNILAVAGDYYMSYTTQSTSLGLAYSSSLNYGSWQSVSAPGWGTSLGFSRIWNGAWFCDPMSGACGTTTATYYQYFGGYNATSPITVTPYVATFDPSTKSWGTPQPVSISPARSYAIIVAEWMVGSEYYALVQDDADNTNPGTGNAFIEIADATSPTGPFTIVGSGNWAGWGSTIESGTEFTAPDGNTAVMFNDWSGGELYYSECNTPSAPATPGCWTAPAEIGNFAPVPKGLPIDWVDVVPIQDSSFGQIASTMQRSSLALQGWGPSYNGPVNGSAALNEWGYWVGPYAGVINDPQHYGLDLVANLVQYGGWNIFNASYPGWELQLASGTGAGYDRFQVSRINPTNNLNTAMITIPNTGQWWFPSTSADSSITPGIVTDVNNSGVTTYISRTPTASATAYLAFFGSQDLSLDPDSGNVQIGNAAGSTTVEGAFIASLGAQIPNGESVVADCPGATYGSVFQVDASGNTHIDARCAGNAVLDIYNTTTGWVPYLESNTAGTPQIGGAGTGFILKASNGTCYPVTVSTSGTLTVGSSVGCIF